MHELINVELNDPWSNVYISGTASCRPNHTNVLLLAELVPNSQYHTPMVKQIERFVPVCNINDTPVTGGLAARTHATRVLERVA